MKRIEIYFIMYLALLMAFFGIEAEVVDYQDSQERMLERLATNMITDIVKPNNFDYEFLEEGRRIKVLGTLLGDFDNEEFSGELIFENKDSIGVADKVFQLNKSELSASIYSATFETAELNENNNHEVKLAFETTPYFSDSTKTKLINALKKPNLAKKIINRIMDEGVIRDTVNLAMRINPSRYDPASVFNLVASLNPFRGIRGTRGEIVLFIRGTQFATDYNLSVDQSSRRRFGINISEGPDAAVLKLNQIVDGRITVTARHNDGRRHEEIIDVRAVEPRWKDEGNNPTEVYLGCSFEFDGRLKELDSPKDERRYTLEVTGDSYLFPDDGIVQSSSYRGPGLSNPGNVQIQVLVDGNEIPGMIHNILVTEAPEPTAAVSSLGGSKLQVIVETYGCNTKIEYVKFRGGHKRSSEEKVKEISSSQGEKEIWTVERKDESRTELIMLVKTSDKEIPKTIEKVIGRSTSIGRR